MKVNYELTLDDCNTYVKETFFMKRLFLYFVKNNICKALFVGIILSLSEFFAFDFTIKAAIIIFIISIPLVYGLWILMYYYSGGKYLYKMLDGLDKNYELTIEDKTIKRCSGSGEHSFSWDNVKEVCNTKRNILIFVSDRMAIIIPKRIFGSEQECNEFWNYIYSCYQNVNNK